MSPSADRVADLETVLLWEGEIDNHRIRELLGVQAVWASRLMGALRKRVGDRAARSTAHAPLRLTPGQQDREKRQSLDDYLRIVVGSESLVSHDPLIEDARRDLSVVAPETFAAVVQAIRKGIGLQIVYRSMNHPTGTDRLVFPHALVRAPRRWHMRAWCTERRDFRDFTLGRLAKARLVESPAPARRSDDKDWNEIATVTIVAHPDLTVEQQRMIAAEYFPGASARQLSVRRCLVGYIVQDLRLATNPSKHKPPEFQLLLSNAQKLGDANWAE
jgi:hypothetical protein